MRYREYDCDICGSDESVAVPHIRRYTEGQAVRICKDCGLVYYNKRRSPQEIARYWDEELYDDGTYDPHRPVESGRYAFAKAFIQKHLSLKGRAVFDIGIGEGQFLEMIREEGAEVCGVESSGRNSRILASKEIPHFAGTIEDYARAAENKRGRADIVTVLFVLQNSQSATDMVDAAHGVLKEGGVLYIQMGSRILVPFKKPMGTYFTRLPQDEQPYHFSFGTLQCLLAKCGFEVFAANNFWDDDLMSVLARKLPREQHIPWLRDDFVVVKEWFERWHRESEKMKRYIKIPPLSYHFPSYHTFYREAARA